jgi:hypothetical protein
MGDGMGIPFAIRIIRCPFNGKLAFIRLLSVNLMELPFNQERIAQDGSGLNEVSGSLGIFVLP